MNDKSFDTIPLCTRSWFFLGLAWDRFAVCACSYKYDFGQIKGFPKNFDFHQDIFNHPHYIKRRKLLGSGLYADTCTNCNNYSNSGSIKQILEVDLGQLSRIEDLNQRMRATDNYARAIASAIKKETIVGHYPAYVGINCGSVCNIKCRICYNRNMEYHPNPADIINVIDNIHETLIGVTLSGGEPQITKAGRALLKEFAQGKYKFSVNMFTNAQRTDFDLLRPVNLTDVIISTDGATKKAYEHMRTGGSFEDLISNIKKFKELQKEKPYMKLRTNFVVTSDNYTDIPEAVKLYESLGIFTMFAAVMTSDKNDPNNFMERSDLYDDILKKADEGISLTSNPYTVERLEAIKSSIYEKMEAHKYAREIHQEFEQAHEEYENYGQSEKSNVISLPRTKTNNDMFIKEIILSKASNNTYMTKIIQSQEAEGNYYIYHFLIKRDGFDYICSPNSMNNEFTFKLPHAGEYKIICSVSDGGRSEQVEYKESIIIHPSLTRKGKDLVKSVLGKKTLDKDSPPPPRGNNWE